ncbi:MAG: sulfatase-like hydrolase/transferase [Lentisphaeria bacterium]|nr:sulfatase-like hydrolase/transferase [Lentisphaeria bacterium]
MNVLWILTDEQRTDSLGCYASPWAWTPSLDALAARGTVFQRAYTPSPVCVSARAAILTGQSNVRLRVLNNHHALEPKRARFLTRVFSGAGYATASFGKHHYNCPGVQAFDTQAGKVLDDRVSYTAYRAPFADADADVVYYPTEFRHWILAGRFPGAVADTAEAENADLALDWLRRRDRGRPFLLRLSLNAPHTPVVAPAPYDRLIDPGAISLSTGDGETSELPRAIRENLCEKAGSWRLTARQLGRCRQVYYGRVAFLDAVVGQFLDRAESLGALDDTLIVFTSDHGCHLGDHGLLQKQSFYEESVRVPWIVAGPGVAGGQVATPVSAGSILPTCLELAGLGCPAPVDFPSLAGALREGGEPPSEPVFSDIDFGIWGYRDGDRYAMVREGDWKLAVFRDPRDKGRFPPDDGLMLHHLATDPTERVNLAGRPEHGGIASRRIALIDRRDAEVIEEPPA